MNLKYIMTKLYNQYEIQQLKKYTIYESLHLVNANDKKINTILFYFSDYNKMHFGDHFFYEPLIRELKEKGFEVFIIPVKQMEFYFEKLGYTIVDEKIFDKVDLIISKIDFVSTFKNVNNQILYVDTATSKIKESISNDLIKKVFKFLKIDSLFFNAVSSNIEVENKDLDKLLNVNEKYILFNNYLESGSFRSGKNHQDSIIQFTKNLKERTGYKVIHTGSLKDKNNDNQQYDFVDFDLRSRTSLSDLFYLSSKENIVYNVSFDAFQMHLFFINNKKSYVLFRGRYLKKNANHIIKNVNPPFKTDNLTKLVEYIE